MAQVACVFRAEGAQAASETFFAAPEPERPEMSECAVFDQDMGIQAPRVLWERCELQPFMDDTVRT